MTVDKFGVTQEEVDKVKDMRVTFLVNEIGEENKPKAQVYEIQEDVPHELEYTDKKTNQKVTVPVLNAKDPDTEVEGIIFLSSKSLKLAFATIYEKYGELTGMLVKISTRMYDHEQWGETKAYTVTKIDKYEGMFGQNQE